MSFIKDPRGYLTAAAAASTFFSLIAVAVVKQPCMIDWNGTVPPNEPPDYELHYKNVDHGRFYIGIFATVFLLQAGILISYLGCMEKLTSVSFDWWFVDLVSNTVATFFVMLATCLWADGLGDARTYYETSHDNRPACNFKYGNFQFGTFLGFISLFVMCGKEYYLYQEVHKTSYEAIDALKQTNYSGADSAATSTEDEVTVSV